MKLSDDKLLILIKYKYKNLDEDRQIEWSVFLQLYIKCNYDGFKCGYCGCELDPDEPYPGWHWPSTDHKMPIRRHGGNNKENLLVCCHRCNMIKNTLSSISYERLIRLIRTYDPNFWETYCEERWLGSQGQKFGNDLEEI